MPKKQMTYPTCVEVKGPEAIAAELKKHRAPRGYHSHFYDAIAASNADAKHMKLIVEKESIGVTSLRMINTRTNEQVK